jgi:hypothetical protein
LTYTPNYLGGGKQEAGGFVGFLCGFSGWGGWWQFVAKRWGKAFFWHKICIYQK